MLSTVEIAELERKVFKYRLKQKLYSIVFGVIIVSMCAVLFYLYSHTSSKSIETQNIIQPIENNFSILKPELNTTQEKVDTLLKTPTLLEKEENLTKEPTQTLLLQLPVIKTTKTDKKTYTPPPIPKEEDIENKVLMRKMNTKAEDTFYRSVDDTIESTMLAPPPLEDEKPKGIIKIETREINSIVYLKEKFEKTHNIIFALMLSEEYYLSKNYLESNKWALIANSIDSENEKSWVWFAKSKVKLGKKEDAVVALQAYLKNNKSKIIETLLSQINMDEVQ